MWRGMVVAAMVMVAGAGMAAADEPSVTATGQSVIKHPPQLLRMSVQVLAEGADVSEAMESLKQQREQARSRLATLGAREDSIAFEEPMVGSGPTDPRQQQMQQMMRMMGRSQPMATKDTVTVTAVLRAEWPLEAAEVDELLITAHQLQEQIRRAFSQQDRELTPEEQEIMEEMQMFGMDDGMTRPGEPSFLFVRKISEEEHGEALAEAFADARQKASRLARAAGVQLGAVKQVRDLKDTAAAGGSSPFDFYMMAMGMDDEADAGAGPLEAVSTRPGMLTYEVGISAVFSLQ